MALAALLSLTGCLPEDKGGDGHGGGTPSGPAMSAVASLTVKGRAPKTGYERAAFGSPWTDTDDNHCDTRVISMLRRVRGAFSQLMRGAVSCAC